MITSQHFRSLSPVHREVLTETVFRKRSVNEAAAVIGVPVEVVKLRVYEALCALRDIQAAAAPASPPPPAVGARMARRGSRQYA